MARMSRALLIAAKVVALAGIALLSVFALDVFGSGEPLPTVVVALLMHLLPSFALLAVLAMAWRWPLAGGLLFLLAGAAVFLFLRNPFGVNLMLAGPLLLAGSLFIGGALSAKAGPHRRATR